MNDNDNGSQEDSDAKQPVIRPISAPMEVPVFNIVIYVSNQDGRVKARVANLPDLQFEASAEPAVLKAAITTVKKQLAEWHGSGVSIPWIEPPVEQKSDEQQRLVPVHL